MYYISGEFSLNTLLAKEAEFSNAYGWTLEQYLDIEKNLPDNIPTIYNFTREQFIWDLIMPYIYQSIDWEHGTCELSLLQTLLEESKNMRQTPENANSSFVNPFALVGKGEQITAGSEITKITSLASAEADAGCALTALGYPTVDGHNGSRFYIRTVVGILNNCKNMDGCLEFIKYIIRNPDNSFIPVYKPILQKMSKKIEGKTDLVSWGKKEYCYSEDDFNKLLNVIHNVRQNNLEDPILYNLVEKEIDPFYADQTDTVEAAKRIESKVSIYVSERCG